MPFGYHGVLSSNRRFYRRAEYVPLSDAVLRQFIGGSGLGVKLLLDEGAATGSARARSSARFSRSALWSAVL